MLRRIHHWFMSRDKYEYSTHLAETDPGTLLLTGTRKLVKRIPDATLGLAVLG